MFIFAESLINKPVPLRCPSIARSKKAPDHKHDNGSYNRADQPGAFTRVPGRSCFSTIVTASARHWARSETQSGALMISSVRNAFFSRLVRTFSTSSQRTDRETFHHVAPRVIPAERVTAGHAGA
jgi:hypothetical protein